MMKDTTQTAIRFTLVGAALAASLAASAGAQAQYGNRYGNDRNSPQVYSPRGAYMGNLNDNRYDPNSVSNPYGRYGSRYSQDSINNPYGQARQGFGGFGGFSGFGR